MVSPPSFIMRVNINQTVYSHENDNKDFRQKHCI